MKIFSLLVLCALSSSLYATEDTHGFYIGGALGWVNTDLKIDPARLFSETHTQVQLDETDSGWKLMTGYRLGRYLSAEFAYTDLGQIEAHTNTPIKANSNVNGLSLSGIAMLPLGENFSLTGRLGLYRWDRSASTLISGLGQLTSVVADDNGTDMVLGVGLNWHLFSRFALRAEWEHFNDLSDQGYDLYSAALLYHFD